MLTDDAFLKFVQSITLDRVCGHLLLSSLVSRSSCPLLSSRTLISVCVRRAC